uniref:Uncharacterized protein n=1 Tax=Ditylenchus dipsaci TaxID=166011 RepID=A0A915D4K9_9BILA
MKQTMEDEKLKDKLSEDDKKKINEKCAETLAWLDANQTAEKEEFEHHQKSWRVFAIQSSPSCTSLLEELQEACPVVQEVQVEPQVPVALEAQQSKKSTKI